MGVQKAGRNGKRKAKPFIALDISTTRTEEWKKLSASEKVIYLYIKRNYNGFNNGDIPFAYSEVKGEFAPATISKSLKELERVGWIEKTRAGGLCKQRSLFKLTECFGNRLW